MGGGTKNRRDYSTSRPLSENVKQRYHQCRNIECSATFRTL
ncbi:hypothetical protein G5645_18030, partial [Pectobacterium carotovorum]